MSSLQIDAIDVVVMRCIILTFAIDLEQAEFEDHIAVARISLDL